MITLTGASVTVPTATAERTILQPVTLDLPERRIALIGENGSGKSTLARLLNGLIEPTSGRVLVDGLDVVRDGVKVRRKVGFMFTDPAAQIVMPTVIEDVALSLRRTHRGKAERRKAALAVLAEHGLDHLAEQTVHGLSGGQRQMLALIGVLATNPDVLVADEPTTLLDLRNARRIGNLLMSLPQQVIIVTHDLHLAARCERGIVVADAQIAYDGPAADAVEWYRASVLEDAC
ncbi:MAG: energy-coupling factor ABC transporter ATP-binding protein [Cumulibacter sp.]